MRIKKNLAISESGFIFNPLSGESYSVNPLGLEIIQMLKEGQSGEEIRRRILNKYQVDETAFEKDFYDFTGALAQYKLIENAEATTT